MLIRYDVENISEETYQKALGTIFSEPPVDFLYEENFPISEKEHIFTNPHFCAALSIMYFYLAILWQAAQRHKSL